MRGERGDAARLADVVRGLSAQPSIERIYLLPSGSEADPHDTERRLELLIIVDDDALPRWRRLASGDAAITGAAPRLHVSGSTDFQSTLQLERSLAVTAVEGGIIVYARSSALRQA